jgi:DNA mismatch endonuclease (patch repair protein)
MTPSTTDRPEVGVCSSQLVCDSHMLEYSWNVDVHSSKQRSFNMSRIKSTDTKPEMVLRRALHAAGFRYRLNVRDLPGKPDIVFTSRRKAIFVNGCFWHMHDCRFGIVIPRTNTDFWQKKRLGTVERDKRVLAELQANGWQTLTVWECELKPSSLSAGQSRALEFLGSTSLG